MKSSLLSNESNVLLGKPPITKSKTTALRSPFVIEGKERREGRTPSSQGRRIVIQVAVVAMLLLILAGSLIASTALGSDAKTNLANVFNPSQHFYNSNADDIAVAAQAATATAVSIYGNDDLQTYSNTNGTIQGGSSNHGWPGQCTDWAAKRFHERTDVWVPWYGNAWEWLNGAMQYHWNVSAMPTVGAILVLQPNVQGAGSYGHVAIVEGINNNGTVHISQYNWQGGVGVYSEWNFSYPDYPRVAFITLP
ncbi:CHAP domain-containing protein [Ktedonospora formicarum]|uniref:CHAP domain-containing protein n=1 Tax=Ktedonospora formicarum TaxID=2778364 RepID=UPI001C68C220|nr:CHAP domain-containing protein [Ktedonospora formicarum]